MFQASRLAFARMRRKLTKRRLAEMTGVSVRSLTAYESGRASPGTEILSAIATALRFPVDFFEGDSIEIPAHEAASFRARSTMTGAIQDSVLASGVIAIELSQWISERFNLPPASVPSFYDHGPEAAADMLRATWGLGDGPISHMLNVLEAHGVRVFSLAPEYQEVDAFSLWQDGVPYVFLNTMKSGERSRFDAAHELGHLVMHRGGARSVDENKRRIMEIEAQRFAAAFLMPSASVRRVVRSVPGITNLIELKAHWGVSATALVHRLHELGYTSDWQYRLLCMHLAQRGHRTEEPNPIPHEKSQVLEKVFRQLRAEGVFTRDIAKDLHVLPDDLNALVFGLAMSAVRGGGNSSIAPPTGPLERVRLVEGGRTN